MIDEDEFLEHANVFGNLYGTPKKGVESFLNAGNDCILEIDVQGGIQVMENAQEYISIFLTPPSTEELERRLRGRGTEEEAVILRRLAGAKEELPKIAYYDYWVVNDTVEGAVKEIESIISAEKNKVDNKINIFKEKFGGNLL
jgi:guanylate kinase